MTHSLHDETESVDRVIWPESEPPPTRTTRCRHCGQWNRVQVPIAVMSPERHQCGACHGGLLFGPEEPLTGIASMTYEHSLDRRSLAALKSLPGLPRLVQWLLSTVGDRSTRILCMAESIQCGDEQFPELVALLEQARRRLDFPARPTLFLGESPHMNAMTTGVTDPVIVVRSALLDQMNDRELVAVLGHELGHLHAGHPLYQNMAHLLLQGGAAASQLVRFLSVPIRRALLQWTRCAELTADRAALLASRDFGACISVMLTFAGGNRPGTTERTRMRLGPFIRQCRALARMQRRDALDGALSSFLTMDRTHPHVAWRVMHLIQWVEHGNYLDILGGHYVRRKPAEASAPGDGPTLH